MAQAHKATLFIKKIINKRNKKEKRKKEKRKKRNNYTICLLWFLMFVLLLCSTHEGLSMNLMSLKVSRNLLSERKPDPRPLRTARTDRQMVNQTVTNSCAAPRCVCSLSAQIEGLTDWFELCSPFPSSALMRFKGFEDSQWINKLFRKDKLIDSFKSCFFFAIKYVNCEGVVLY